MKNIQFEIGYNQGYCWVAYEGGSLYHLKQEVRYRGIPYKSISFVAFKQGCEDASKGLPNKYPS